ncbi:hypothetical protein HPP92_012073 [Vanilla planifolia]|uniref:Uncharacterized protein n=1 Tax=Vanilla planifolia TaxID=51239 RepID=A0A835R471_VANPL|nr:hypothetical protein HPP92_012073 [Vanilla planifolia]
MPVENGTSEIIEIQLPLPLEVSAGLEGGGDLVFGSNEEPSVHATGAGAEGSPTRSFCGFPEESVLRNDELSGLGQRTAEALDLPDREAVAPESGHHLAAVKFALQRLPPQRRIADRRDGAAEVADAAEDRNE